MGTGRVGVGQVETRGSIPTPAGSNSELESPEGTGVHPNHGWGENHRSPYLSLGKIGGTPRADPHFPFSSPPRPHPSSFCGFPIPSLLLNHPRSTALTLRPSTNHGRVGDLTRGRGSDRLNERPTGWGSDPSPVVTSDRDSGRGRGSRSEIVSNAINREIPNPWGVRVLYRGRTGTWTRVKDPRVLGRASGQRSEGPERNLRGRDVT